MIGINFSKPQRESILAILFLAGFSLRKLLTIFWPLFVIYIFKGQLGQSLWFYTAVLFLLIVSLVSGFLSWKYFYFYIRDNEFVVEKGYLKKSIITIPLEKIITVNTNQKLLHRLLGVVELVVDSAGSEKQEVKINAVSHHYARQIQEALLETQNRGDGEVEKQDEKKEIVALNLVDLLKIGIARNHLEALLLFFVSIMQLQNEIRDLFKEEVASALNTTMQYLKESDVFIWTILLLVIVLGSVMFSIIRTILFNFDLKLWQTEKSFILKWGLWKHKTVTMPIVRIQATTLLQNPLQRILGISTMQLIQASGKEVLKNSEKILVRGCRKNAIKQIRDAIIPPFLQENKVLLKPDIMLLNRKLFTGHLLFIPAVIVVYYQPFLLWLLVVLEIFIVVNALYVYKHRKYLINNEIIDLYSGSFFVQKVATTRHYKIQAVVLHQSFFQRRKGVASLRLSIAGSNLNITHIPHQEAVAIRNFILYEINERNRKWMT